MGAPYHTSYPGSRVLLVGAYQVLLQLIAARERRAKTLAEPHADPSPATRVPFHAVHIMGDIEPAFDDVLAFMKSESAASPSQDQMLSMYALYKQASMGDCEGTRPGLLDVVARAKYDAWAALRGTPTPEAMQLYISAAIALDPAAAGPAGSFATAASTSPSAVSAIPPPAATSADVDDAGALASAFKPFGRLE